jgi:hypothetical protein
MLFTLTDIEVMTGDTLKSKTPYRLAAAVITGYVFMFDVLVYVVG